MVRVFVFCGVITAFASLFATEVGAQSRPAVTQDPEPVGSGKMLVDLGVDYSRSAFYPVSGLHGNLTRFGTFDLSFGVSSVAEILLDGGFHNRLAITERDPAPLASLVSSSDMSTGDVEDGVIGAKVRFLPETTNRPALAIRFATRLPNSKHESGLGMDTMDFNFSLLSGKTVGTVRFVGDFGWSILEDPIHDGIQNDVVTYGGSVAQTVAPGVELVGDINGRADTRHGVPPIGTESRSALHLGVRYTRSILRCDAALLVGLTSHDPSWGITAGLTWVFSAFKIP